MKKNITDNRDALTLDLIRAEGLRGRVYSMAQFARMFENFRAEDYDWPEGEEWKHRKFIRKNNPVVLTFDLGVTSGWALRSSDGAVMSGSIILKSKPFEREALCDINISQFLYALHSRETVSQIYFKEVSRHLCVDDAHAYRGFLSDLTAWCEKNAIALTGVPAKNIKKHATGKRNATKNLIIKSVVRRGHSPKDYREASAISLVYLAIGNR